MVDFFWGHVGWLFVENRETPRLQLSQIRPRRAQRSVLHEAGAANHVGLGLRRPRRAVLLGRLRDRWATTGEAWAGVQFGSACSCGASSIRTIFTWHVTWGVNSASHLWGYRNYDTRENSRNNWLFALATNGEGWHNNHHADPRTAAHGHRWWELDVTYLRSACGKRWASSATSSLPRPSG